MYKGEEKSHILSTKTCLYVWGLLVLFLGATIAVANFQLLLRFSVVAALFIASLKAALVFLYFMELKYEGWFLKGMLLMALAVLGVSMAFTFLDVWYR
jgi:cytochrome c oxidase subunit IV